MQRGQTGYYVDGNIVRLTTQPAGSFAEVSCDLKVVLATWEKVVSHIRPSVICRMER